MTVEFTRRLFLRNSAAAGTVAATAAVPVIANASVKTAEERARFHYAEFAKAMGEVVAHDAGHHGWMAIGGHRQPYRSVRGGSWVNLNLIRFENSDDPRCPALVIERHGDCDVLAGWRP